ncbi:MAG: M16 family metallopeptidase, partial [Steroidobacteraceae bacterium]
DVTVYQTWIPRAALELALSLEADRIARLTFDPAIVERERRVVRSERRLCVDDNPAALLSERVQAAAFVAHSYRFPTIGLPEDIGSWRLGDLRKFYRAYYAPGNQTFVIAGDVEADRALALARKLLEPIAPREPPPEVRTREPRQLGERRVVIERQGHTPLLQYAYKAPAASDRRAPALRLLLAALVDGDASRLHRRLVEDRKIAVEVSGEWHEGFDPALFWLHLMLPEGADTSVARRMLDAELARIVEEGITPAELERAKSLNAVQHFRQLATLDGKAHLLGEYEVLRGGWRALLDAPQRLDAVTRTEVQAVAREVLDPRRRCSGVLEPTRHGRA